MLTAPNASALNCERRNLVLALEEMEVYVAQTKAVLAEPVTTETKVITRASLTQYLGISSRVTERIAGYDISIAARLS